MHGQQRQQMQHQQRAIRRAQPVSMDHTVSLSRSNSPGGIGIVPICLAVPGAAWRDHQSAATPAHCCGGRTPRGWGKVADRMAAGARRAGLAAAAVQDEGRPGAVQPDDEVGGLLGLAVVQPADGWRPPRPLLGGERRVLIGRDAAAPSPRVLDGDGELFHAAAATAGTSTAVEVAPEALLARRSKEARERVLFFATQALRGCPWPSSCWARMACDRSCPR